MATESVKSDESSGLAEQIAVCVLVVDSDSTCVAIVSKMLHWFGHKVMTAKRAADALCIIQEKGDELDAILTENDLPDMNKYQFLETMKEISKLPIAIMSADEDENVMLGCLFKGAAFYHVKPLTMDDVDNIWQFAFRMRGERMITVEWFGSFQEELEQENASNEDIDCQSFVSEGKQSYQNAKREEPREMYQDENVSDESIVLQKPKISWTNELHKTFLQAITLLGIGRAHPEDILKLMNIPGLTTENIASHLQKYCLSLKPEQDGGQKNMKAISIEPDLASVDSLSTTNFIGASPTLPMMQSDISGGEPELLTQFEKRSCMAMPSIGSMHFLDHVKSCCIDSSNSGHGHLSLARDQLGSTYLDSTTVGNQFPTDKEFGGFHQSRNFSMEEYSEGQMELSVIGGSGFGSAICTGQIKHLQQRQEQVMLSQSSLLSPSLL